MTECDNCGRATSEYTATTFPNSSVVICERSGCEDVANEAKLLYYEQGAEAIKGELIA